MKNRIRELGDDWFVLKADIETIGPARYMLSPERHRDVSEPYCAWLIEGKDFEVIETDTVKNS